MGSVHVQNNDVTIEEVNAVIKRLELDIIKKEDEIKELLRIIEEKENLE